MAIIWVRDFFFSFSFRYSGIMFTKKRFFLFFLLLWGFRILSRLFLSNGNAIEAPKRRSVRNEAASNTESRASEHVEAE